MQTEKLLSYPDHTGVKAKGDMHLRSQSPLVTD